MTCLAVDLELLDARHGDLACANAQDRFCAILACFWSSRGAQNNVAGGRRGVAAGEGRKRDWRRVARWGATQTDGSAVACG